MYLKTSFAIQIMHKLSEKEQQKQKKKSYASNSKKNIVKK